MPEKPTIRTRAKTDPEVRALLESVLAEFGQADKQDLLKEIARARLTVKEMKAKEASTLEELSQLKHHGQDLEGLIDVLRKDLLVSEEKEKQTVASADQDKGKIGEDRKKYQDRIARLENSLKSLKEEHSRTLQRERTTYKKGQGAESARVEAQTRVTDLEKERAKIEEGLRAREVMLRDFQERLEAQSKSHEEEVGRLREQVGKLNLEIGKTPQFKEAEGDLSLVRASLKDTEAALQARQSTLEAQAREMERLRRGAGETGRYKNTIRILEGEINNAAEKIESLSGELALLKGQLQERQESHSKEIEEVRAMLSTAEAAGGSALATGPGSIDLAGPETRLVELEIALAKAEAEQQDAVEPLEARIKGLEKEVAARKKSEEALRTDVEEITALARAERESHLEAARKLEEQAGPEGSAGEARRPQSGELRKEILRLGDEVEAVIEQGTRIEEYLSKLRQESKKEDGATSKRLVELKSRSAEFAKTLDDLATSMEGDGSLEEGNWSQVDEAIHGYQQKHKELRERVARMRKELEGIEEKGASGAGESPPG